MSFDENVGNEVVLLTTGTGLLTTGTGEEFVSLVFLEDIVVGLECSQNVNEPLLVRSILLIDPSDVIVLHGPHI